MKTFLVLAGFAVLAVAGCSDDEEAPSAPTAGTGGSGGSSGRGGTLGTGGSAGTAATGGTGGTSDSGTDAPTSITISGRTHDWNKADPFAAPPLAGVRVCLHGHPEVACQTTGADGNWALSGVPVNAEVLVSLELADHVSFLRAIKTATADIVMQQFENAMVPQSEVAGLLPNVTVDLAKGGIVFFITTPGMRFQNAFDWFRGFTVTATPSSGLGPLYLDATHTHDPAATASVGGFGQYVNLDAGTYTLEFTVPSGVTCNQWPNEVYGYPTGQPLRIRVPVVAGFSTGPVGFFCTSAPSDAGTDAADASDAAISDGGTG
jgi:hypothetical protein